MGTKRKFWYRDEQGCRFLFKYCRENTGEDWSEKLASEVAAALGVPHARVELAVCEEQPGTISLGFTDEASSLIHGNELLQRHLPAYLTDAGYHASMHTVAAVLHALGNNSIHPPAGAEEPDLVTAVDWFMGYLMLDALLGNTDRHHENWAVLERWGLQDRRIELAPSYDHASSLGRELTDGDRTARLTGKDLRRTVVAYAAKTRSALYRSPEEPRPLSPIDALREAMPRSRRAALRWLERLAHLSEADLTALVYRVPLERMTEPARRFAITLMATNRVALLSLAEQAP